MPSGSDLVVTTGTCIIHHSRARSWVHALVASTSDNRCDSSRAEGGRLAGALARQDITRSSSALGIGISIRADGGVGGVCACCTRYPIGVSAVNTNSPVRSQYATQPIA